MEGNTLPYKGDTAQKLADAGASRLFIDFYRAASSRQISSSVVREVDNDVFTIDDLAENPSLAGGFFEALWNGNRRTAERSADSTNSEVLEKYL